MDANHCRFYCAFYRSGYFSVVRVDEYVVLSAVLLAIGIGCTVLSLACHDGLKSPRLVYFLVVLVGGALLLALPYA